MSSPSSPPAQVPESASSLPASPVSADEIEGTTQPTGTREIASLTCEKIRHPRRTRQIVSIVMIAAGLVLLVISLQSQNLGIASTEGASWTQVAIGVVGTILLVTGLALIAQAFEDSNEPPTETRP